MEKYLYTIGEVARIYKIDKQGFPGGSLVKNLPASVGGRVSFLMQKDPTCHGAAKPERHNC